jgi:hypothetical protein
MQALVKINNNKRKSISEHNSISILNKKNPMGIKKDRLREKNNTRIHSLNERTRKSRVLNSGAL